ncbi:16S rRNA (guanine(527)-N(7))-methyltransferase RsmG [uncultured Eubacterium sp.]|uniref:16S rRNA (guanine(527)-N(7))-methyltransferase RsmG n=1 Tax=uncultured Eubacterium sp. TaxID=165185 RepID=UPI0025F0002A|nr:16S rRNA (guanine(527)-N(7))-methyltransferase RsmG [uncultured Eubacterium sp.]
MIDKVRFSNLCEQNGIFLDEVMLERFDIYARLLVEWNEKMNLTAITEPREIELKHFLDSLMLIKYYDLQNVSNAIDVGAGAGFPSMPILIYKPEIEFTLLDSLNKRLTFLSVVNNELGLDAKLVHSRAEVSGQEENYREKFDLAIARAVAPMNVLSEYCIPFVKEGGAFVALKGSNDDVSEAGTAIEVLGGKLESNISYELGGTEPRTIAVVRKISQTPTQYPRKSKKISTKPL